VSDILDQIVEATRRDLDDTAIDWRSLNRAARMRSEKKPKHWFHAALRRKEGKGPNVIAEVKAASPSAGVIVENPDVERIVAEYRDGGAAAISVVTEPHFFKGDRTWIYRASTASALPVIMKDFVIHPFQVYRGIAAGADAVLLLASILEAPQIRELIAILDELHRDALVEVHDEGELAKALEGGARIIGVNNRDLRDFSVDLAISERLAEAIPPGLLKVSESGIRTPADVERLRRAGFDAFLVGESLLRQADRRKALEELRGGSGP
jgi:indole-3-glycerol phosphate synthase